MQTPIKRFKLTSFCEKVNTKAIPKAKLSGNKFNPIETSLHFYNNNKNLSFSI